MQAPVAEMIGQQKVVAVESVIAKGSDEVANCSNDTPIFNENNSGGANETRKQEQNQHHASLKYLVSDNDTSHGGHLKQNAGRALSIFSQDAQPVNDLDEKLSMAMLSSGGISGGLPNEQLQILRSNQVLFHLD